MRIGVTVSPEDGPGADVQMGNAEIALHRAKDGDHPVRCYGQGMGEQLIRRLETANRLEQALQQDGLALAFQPQIELATNRLLAAEVLLRWSDEVRGPISPAEFLPLAEERGLMSALGRWVLRAACRQLAA